MNEVGSIMNQKKLILKISLSILTVFFLTAGIFSSLNFQNSVETKTIQGEVTQVTPTNIIFKDERSSLYIIPKGKEDYIKVRDEIVILYVGEIQEVSPAIIKNIVKIERK